MIRVFVRLVADAAFVALLLFVSAGTVVWWRAWVLLAVLLVLRTVSAIAVDAVTMFALVPVAFVVTRLNAEERFLRRELPGYAAYAVRVRHRLVPGIW